MTTRGIWGGRCPMDVKHPVSPPGQRSSGDLSLPRILRRNRARRGNTSHHPQDHPPHVSRRNITGRHQPARPETDEQSRA
jgi:hypothetical protein